MIQFIKNTGQYHRQVAWVAKIEGPLTETYRGCGLAWCKPGMDRLDYVGDEGANPAAEYDPGAGLHLPIAKIERLRENSMVGALSCYELIAERGTALTTYLNTTGGVL